MTQNVERHLAQQSADSPVPHPLPDEGRGGLEASTPSRDLGRLSKGRKKGQSTNPQNIASASCSSSVLI